MPKETLKSSAKPSFWLISVWPLLPRKTRDTIVRLVMPYIGDVPGLNRRKDNKAVTTERRKSVSQLFYACACVEAVFMLIPGWCLDAILWLTSKVTFIV
jgi:hypothetical protein